MVRKSSPPIGDADETNPLEFMVREVQALNQEINSLKRETRAVLGLVVTAAGVVAPIQDKYKTDIAAILLPFLLVGLAAYGMNLNAEIAALAEQRDRLIQYVNRKSGTKVFLGRIISDNRRGSLGTALTWGLAGLIVLASIGIGGYFAAQRPTWVWVSFSLFMLFSLAALVSAFLDLPLTRHHVNHALDEELGDWDRPDTSPSSATTRWQTIDRALFGRKKGQQPPKKWTDFWNKFPGPAKSGP